MIPFSAAPRPKALLRAVALALVCAAAGLSGSARGADPHHNAAGFFDIHVCNWPDQPLFFMALFSTTRFQEIARLEVLDPEGRVLGELGLERYRLVRKPGQSEKRVFMDNIPAANARDGWYGLRATLKDGSQLTARDYVIVRTLPRAANLNPPPDAEDIALPKALTWDPVSGAQYYQVFIKDLWDGERLIYQSAYLDRPRLELPAGLLQPGGLYAWRVHARDVNEHELLGDFNHGSLSPEIRFSVAP